MSISDRRETVRTVTVKRPLPPEQIVPPETQNRLKALMAEKKDQLRVGDVHGALTAQMPGQPAGAAAGAGETTETTEKTSQPTTKTGVLILYILIIAVLGGALWASLASGKSDTFSTSIITALTTIAGTAVGANVTKGSQ